MTILSNGHQWKYSEFLDNKNYSFDKKQILNSLSEKEIDDAYSSISKWEGYAPTPLISLNKLSNELDLNKIYYKDESKRFDLKSFKALGGAYAVEKATQGNKNITVATATAGNHGRSVAWGARRLGLKCKIFISEFVSDARGQAMADLGADVIKVKGNYEKSLIECIKQSTENNWQIVQDVAWKNYMRNFFIVNLINNFFHHNCVTSHRVCWNLHIIFPSNILYYLPIIFCGLLNAFY